MLLKLCGDLLHQGRVLFFDIIKAEEIRDILRVKSIDPSSDDQRLIKQLDFPVLLLIEGLVARHINVTLQMHSVNLDDLLDHPVQEVDPPQAHLCVDLVRLAVTQPSNVILFGFVLDKNLDLICDRIQINCAAIRRQAFFRV